MLVYIKHNKSTYIRRVGDANKNKYPGMSVDACLASLFMNHWLPLLVTFGEFPLDTVLHLSPRYAAAELMTITFIRQTARRRHLFLLFDLLLDGKRTSTLGDVDVLQLRVLVLVLAIGNGKKMHIQ